jgi:mannose-6-phosphate isomerase-like protein (cupin superfamily)
MKLFKWDRKNPDIRLCGAFNGCPLQIARLCIKDVYKNEVLHMHPKGHEFYLFIKGKAEMVVGGKTLAAGPGDVVVVEPGEVHRVTKILAETDYIVIKNNTDPADKKVI